ncbi:MAG: P1 family peptidase [Vicinamibacteria bacterium]
MLLRRAVPVALAVCALALPSRPASAQSKGLTEVPGIKVGHFTLAEKPTGCTVILTEYGATGGVDVRGGAPGTRETDLLEPRNRVSVVHAVVLSGGSAFGLDAASGTVRWLEERGYGIDVRVTKVPIVPSAILFDLPLANKPQVRPTADCGYKAAGAANDGPVAEGNVGAGAGATVGKLGFGRSMKAGIGTAAIRMPDGTVVGAIVAVNAVGDIIDPATGKVVAGVRTEDGKGLADARVLLRSGAYLQRRERPAAAPPRQGDAAATSKDGHGPASERGRVHPGEALFDDFGDGMTNTTIGLVATNAPLTKAQAQKVAQMAHDGFARAISPVHTPSDGDTIFALGTGKLDVPTDDGRLSMIGALAAEAMADAIVRAATQAVGIPELNLPAARDLPPAK